MTREERENALHCLKVMIDEEVCEECKLYGSTGTDHCEADCVRVAIKALEETKTWFKQEPCDAISRPTNGEMFLTLFTPYKVCVHKYAVHIYMTEKDFMRAEYQVNYDIDWWNAPYKSEVSK